MQRRYVTVDVFTDRIFGGNPLAVVLDAQELTGSQMQAIAAEFNYSETTFVLPPRDEAHTAQVRIFTPRSEMPFAGHPNVGTAVVLARELEAKGSPADEQLLFEELAGLVPVQLIRENRKVVAAELTAPEALSVRASASIGDAAACLGLPAADISSAGHPPQVLSVGLPFLVAEVVSRDALRRARPDLQAHERVLRPLATDAIFLYCRGSGSGELHARMFAPLDGITEDPATGSATAAAIAQLAALHPDVNSHLSWRVEQGVDMGRPSLLLGRTVKRSGKVESVHVAGHAVQVMEGTLVV